MRVKEGLTYLTGTTFILLISCCMERKVATITRDYVINPNWDEIDNSFQVTRMNFKNSNDSIDLKKVVQPELLEKLVEDAGFSFTANVKYNGKKYSERKVYFNRDNGFVWWADDNKSSRKILGELQQGRWYLLAGLSRDRNLYYVYTDSLDSIHYFKIGASNW